MDVVTITAKFPYKNTFSVIHIVVRPMNVLKEKDSDIVAIAMNSHAITCTHMPTRQATFPITLKFSIFV
jgi:hypothetical protein